MKTIQVGKATLIQGDCMEYMSTLQDKAFDLAVVDPPYGIGASRGIGRSLRDSDKIIKKLSWDDAIPDHDYFSELLRTSENRVIWGGNYFPLPPARCFLIWDKLNSGRNFADCEQAWTSFDKVARIFVYRVSTDHKERFHPTQKPVKLYEWIFTNYAKPGQRILDTHGGSMSSVIAALNLGFEIVCIEKDEEYFNSAADRVIKSQQQQRMF